MHELEAMTMNREVLRRSACFCHLRAACMLARKAATAARFHGVLSAC